MTNAAVRQQRHARQLWRDCYYPEAAEAYRKAAEMTTGFARQVNLKCAADCAQRLLFQGTPRLY